MKRLEFHISYICNHNCIFCSEYDRLKKYKKNPISFLEIKAILIDRRKK
jgi:wyosine [tRNA(Phe)-imidazoG37] synthetase (radical SAM superfamily)